MAAEEGDEALVDGRLVLAGTSAPKGFPSPRIWSAGKPAKFCWTICRARPADSSLRRWGSPMAVARSQRWTRLSMKWIPMAKAAGM